MSHTRRPAPSPLAHVSFSQNVGTSLRWWLRIAPSSPISTLLFQRQPTLSAVPSLKPSDTTMPARRAASAMRSSSGPGQRMLLAARRLNHS